MSHIYRIDNLISGKNIPPRAKVIAKKLHELHKKYNTHSTPIIVGKCGEWEFRCYIRYDSDPMIQVIRNIGVINYILTTFSFQYACKVFPEIALSDDTVWQYWNFTGDDFKHDGEWLDLENE